MVKKTENGFSIAPFLMKCYEMVDDQSTNALISWGSSSDSFTIWNVTDFSSKLLPKYFKHSNFSSFIRQLNIYGFRKIDTDSWIFASDQFLKGQKHLLKNISRRKQRGLVQQKTTEKKEEVVACEETKEFGIWKEVEALKTDKIALMQELGILRQHQQTSYSKLLLVRQQLQGMEKNQQQMLSFLVTTMQNPGLLVQLLQPKESKWCRAEGGKKVVKRVIDDPEPLPAEGAIVRYQPPMEEIPEPIDTVSNSDMSFECSLSSDELRDLFMNMDMDFLSAAQADESPLVLPDLPDDDSILERLLSTLPECDIEEPSDSGRDKDSAALTLSQIEESDEFDFVNEEFDTSRSLMMDTTAIENQVDNFQYMDIITEQMGLLASESSLGY